MEVNASPNQCGICLEEYNESERCPRILSCSHTFCSECIGNLISNNKKQCPFCRRGFDATINDIMINYAALDFIRCLTVQNIDAKHVKKATSVFHSSKVEKMKKEALEDNDIKLKDCQEARQRMEDKIREIKDLECTIVQENSQIEKEILPKIQDVIIQNSKTLEELKQTRIQLENQIKEIKIRQENLNDVKQKIQTTTAGTFQEVGELLDEVEEVNATVSSTIEETHVIITDEEKALAVKQKRVEKDRKKSKVILEQLSSPKENEEDDKPLQELGAMAITAINSPEYLHYRMMFKAMTGLDI